MQSEIRAPIFQLKISLKHIQPPIWRRVLVPGNVSLEYLHLVIQTVMPWLDYHLHHFQKGEIFYGVPHPEDYLDYVDSSDTELSDILVDGGDKIIYEYDFGDSWNHEILLEHVLEADPEIPYPICVAGERACPPEDCGGTHGFAHMLESLADPKHEEYESYIVWTGGGYDPGAFDLEEVNANLRMMLWEPGSVLQLVNRYVVVIKPLQPMVNWVKTTCDFLFYNSESAQQDCTSILVPQIEDPSELQEFLRMLKPMLFERELAAWYKDPSAWPQHRTTELFDEWFMLELHSMVWDSAWDEPIVHE